MGMLRLLYIWLYTNGEQERISYTWTGKQETTGIEKRREEREGTSTRVERRTQTVSNTRTMVGRNRKQSRAHPQHCVCVCVCNRLRRQPRVQGSPLFSWLFLSLSLSLSSLLLFQCFSLYLRQRAHARFHRCSSVFVRSTSTNCPIAEAEQHVPC